MKNPIYDMSLGEDCERSLEAIENGCGAADVDMARKPGDSGVLESAKMADCEISACAVSTADAIREALDKAQRPVIMLGHGVSDKAVRDSYLLWHVSGKSR